VLSSLVVLEDGSMIEAFHHRQRGNDGLYLMADPLANPYRIYRAGSRANASHVCGGVPAPRWQRARPLQLAAEVRYGADSARGSKR